MPSKQTFVFPLSSIRSSSRETQALPRGDCPKVARILRYARDAPEARQEAALLCFGGLTQRERNPPSFD